MIPNIFLSRGAGIGFPCGKRWIRRSGNEAILGRIRQVMRYAYGKAPFYRRKWDEAGVHPDRIRSLEDFERVPVVTKTELRESQERAAPFGDFLCIPESEIHHIHGTSGTTGRPTAFAIGRSDWDAIANAQARVMWGMGIRPGDTVFIAGVFSLYMGSWGTLAGAERLRAKCFPFGAGAPGNDGSGGDVDEAGEADGFLRHTLLRLAPR